MSHSSWCLQVENEYSSYYACEKKYMNWVRDETGMSSTKSIQYVSIARTHILMFFSFRKIRAWKSATLYGRYSDHTEANEMRNSGRSLRNNWFWNRGGRKRNGYCMGKVTWNSTHWSSGEFRILSGMVDSLARKESKARWWKRSQRFKVNQLLKHWNRRNISFHLKTKMEIFSRKMLDAGASVNIYMFFGGTNFGFTAGKIVLRLMWNNWRIFNLNFKVPTDHLVVAIRESIPPI